MAKKKTSDAAADPHFVGKDPRLRSLFAAVLRAASRGGRVEVAPAKSAILLRADANFASVVVRRAWLDVEFLLDRPLDSARVHRALRLSARRVASTVRVPVDGAVDAELAGWLREARALRP